MNQPIGYRCGLSLGRIHVPAILVKTREIGCKVTELVNECPLVGSDDTEDVFADKFFFVNALEAAVLGQGVSNQLAQFVLNLLQSILVGIALL